MNSYDSSPASHAAPLPPHQPGVSSLAPLRYPIFRALWLASIASNIGTWMQNIGATWLMGSLSPSPFLISLVQAANFLPVFLLALPAGAIADLFDRRKVLIFTQTWMLIAAALLGILSWKGLITDGSLLALTFMMGVGSALNAPAWQAIIPEMVPPEEIAPAIALGSAAFNVARAVGPALGGLIVAAASPAANFFLNAVSFLAVIFVLFRWKRPVIENQPLPERLIEAMISGLRYVRHAPALHSVLVRSLAFVIPASALWALLPVVTRDQLHSGPSTYGILLGCLGAGAVLGTFTLGHLRRRVSTDLLMTIMTLLFAMATAAAALSHSVAVVALFLIGGGAAWLCLLASLNTLVQISVPEWVRARALSIYLLVFFGGMTGGSALWGVFATAFGLQAALSLAAFALIISLVSFRFSRLTEVVHAAHLTPSHHWPEPASSESILPQRGPVLVLVEYRINPELARPFNQVARRMESARRRDGAYRWRLFEDPGVRGKYVETFLVNTWAEHLRQHGRVTVSDRMLEEEIRAYHLGDTPPVVTHLIAMSR